MVVPGAPGTVWVPLVERTYAECGGDAAFALLLPSPGASWIDGDVFAADGGYAAR